MQRKDNKAKDNGGGAKGRIKAFAFGFEMEGNSEELAEGIKAFTAAMARTGAVVPVAAPRALAAPKTTQAAAPDAGIEEEDELPESPELEAQEDDAEGTAESANGGGKKRSYAHKAPKFKHDLDLSKATKLLPAFMAEKGNPPETQDRYVVIAVWLKEHMGVGAFTIDDIWTAYNHLGWKSQMPENHSQPLRDLKSKKNFLTKEKGEGYKVSWPGEQYVAKMGAAQ
jgi:hypothetical protein